MNSQEEDMKNVEERETDRDGRCQIEVLMKSSKAAAVKITALCMYLCVSLNAIQNLN